MPAKKVAKRAAPPASASSTYKFSGAFQIGVMTVPFDFDPTSLYTQSFSYTDKEFKGGAPPKIQGGMTDLAAYLKDNLGIDFTSVLPTSLQNAKVGLTDFNFTPTGGSNPKPPAPAKAPDGFTIGMTVALGHLENQKWVSTWVPFPDVAFLNKLAFVNVVGSFSYSYPT